MEFLNVSLVRQLAVEKGLKINWIVSQIGMSRTSGYSMFREGLLPKTEQTKKKALKVLAKLLSVDVSALTLSIVEKRRN